VKVGYTPLRRRHSADGAAAIFRLTIILSARYYRGMAKKNKPMTVAEAGRRGGKARAKKYSREQLSVWAKRGGWPKGRPRKKRGEGER
jgi:hypothetical protein